MLNKQILNIYKRLNIIAMKNCENTIYYNHNLNIIKDIDKNVKKNEDYYKGITQLLDYLHFPEYNHIIIKKEINNK